jgi:phosphatidylglycerophosphatase GEP4
MSIKSFFILLFLAILTETRSIASNTIKSKYFLMKQSINLSSLRQLGKFIMNPRLLVPNYYFRSVNDLDMESLYMRGARYVIFDKDNTLTVPFEEFLDNSVKDVVTSLKNPQSKFYRRIAILSNSVGSSNDPDYQMAKETEQTLGIPVIRHFLKKPDCLKEVLEHFDATVGNRKGNVNPREIVIVGDRVLTDIVFGNMHNMLTVLVKPLTVRRDHPVSAIIRFLEINLLLPFVRLLLTIFPI